MKKPPDDQKKRSDVSERLSSNKNMEFVTVKSTLNSFLSKEFTDKNSEFYMLLHNPLKNILLDVNKVMVEAHILSNLHVLRMLEKGIAVIPNQDYFYKCISAVSKSAIKKKVIDSIHFKESVEIYKSQRSVEYKQADGSYISAGIFNCLSLQMATESSNFIEMQFYRIFVRFLKNKYDLDNSQVYKLIKDIRSLEYNNKNIIVLKYRDLIKKLIDTIPKDEFKEISEENLKKIKEKMDKSEAKRILKDLDNEKKFINSKKGQKETDVQRKERILKKEGQQKQEQEQKLHVKENLQETLKRYKQLEHPYVALPILYRCLKYFEDVNIKYDEESFKEEKTRTKATKKRYKNRHRNRDKKQKLKTQENVEFHEEITETKESKKLKKLKKHLKNYKHVKNNSVFSILPMKHGFTISHIKLCNTGLYGLLKRAEIEEPEKMQKFLKLKNLKLQTSNNWKTGEAHKYWSAFFNINSFETANRKFSGEIQTDGKAVSISIKRTKIKLADAKTQEEFMKENYNNMNEADIVGFIESRYKNIIEFLKDKYKNKEIWGLDPGHTDVFVASSSKKNYISVTTRSYYEESKFKESNRIIKGYQDRDPVIKQIIKTIPSHKTSKIEQICIYTKFLLKNIDYLLKFNMVKGLRTLKLKRYIFSNKKLNSMCKPFKDSIVGFGDWSNNDTGGLIKSCVKGPVKKFERYLRKHSTVISIDEFRTSKLHNKCFLELKNQYSLKKLKDGSCCNQKVHSVLHCKSNGCLGITMNRDDNASENILDILLYQLIFGPKQRHPAFDRSRNLEEAFTKSASLTLFINLKI